LIISGSSADVHDARLHAQAAGNRHALLLAAGKLAGELMRLLGDLDPLQQPHRVSFGLLPGDLAHPDRGQRAVLEDGEMREQVEVLEHHANLGPDLVDVLQIRVEFDIVDDDVALLVLLQPVDTADQGRLAGTGRPADHDPLAPVDGQVDVAEHMELAIPFVHVVDLDGDLVRDMHLREIDRVVFRHMVVCH
jgi:hypothetical protein